MQGIASIQEILEEARAGRPFILVDAADRENEGDIVIPAEFATAEIVNFMAAKARGLICLALTGERADALRLRPMVPVNRSGHGTAFTVSIEAREGVTTGISAQDRARTIAVAIDPGCGPADIATPGHVFPLVARAAGVLERPGHTEAAVDIARLAGLTPAGVICEVMKDDGSMARLPDLLVFAREHGLKLGTIADLIAWRRSTEDCLEKVLEAATPFRFGDDFTAHVYRDRVDGTEHLALTRGRIRAGWPTLVHVHRPDFVADLLGRGGAVDQAPRLEWLAAHPGPVAAVFLRGAAPERVSSSLRGEGGDVHPGTLAAILRDLGVGEMELLDTILPARRLAEIGWPRRAKAAQTPYTVDII